ncbi:uncharacterized protein LOC134816141 [Bolinopsis microptera]|uniref:uncharacterized protein LOC134816141 n=1 Tax=Bolinopsis microptera TaxID=2820187 RepID=UPI00307A912D
MSGDDISVSSVSFSNSTDFNLRRISRSMKLEKLEDEMFERSLPTMIPLTRMRRIKRAPATKQMPLLNTSTPRQKNPRVTRRLTVPQRIFLCKEMYKGATYNAIEHLWMTLYPDENAPSRTALYHLKKKFEEHGTVQNLQCVASGRPRTGVSLEHTLMVYESLQDLPNISTRERAIMLDIPRTTLRRIIKELKPEPA